MAEWRDFLSGYSDDYLRLADEDEVAPLDHLPLIVADQDATIDFYTRVLGMEAISFSEGRTALAFGDSRIGLQVAAQDERMNIILGLAPGIG